MATTLYLRARQSGLLIPALAAAVIAILPFLGLIGGLDERKLLLAALYTALVAGFNLSFGYGGQLALGQVAVFAGGAYTAAILFSQGVNDLAISIAAGIAVAAVFGFITGLPGLRFGGWALALVSFFSVLLIPDLVVIFDGISQGPNGIAGIVDPKLFGIGLSKDAFYVLCIVATAASLFLVRNLMISRFGQSMLVLKEGVPLATSLGLAPHGLRMRSYVIGGLPAGLAGVLYAYLTSYVQQGLFDFQLVTLLLAISIIAGTTSVWAVAPAAALLVFVPEGVAAFQQYSTLAYGIFLALAAVGFVGGLAAAGKRIDKWILARSGTNEDAEGARAVASTARPEQARLPGVRLEVEGVAKAFDNVHALRDVSIEAEPGKVTAIIGANGAGKTTLLNAISGHIDVDKGDIRLGGRSVSGLGPSKRARQGIARTFQAPRIPELLTVREAVAAACFSKNAVNPGAIALRTPSYWRTHRQDLERADAALAFIGHESDPDAIASEERLAARRMLEVARCIAAQPSLIMLDEPAAGLDSDAMGRLMQALSDLRAAGETVILIEHNVSFVMEVADEIIVMDLGGVLAKGTPAEIRDDPRVIASYLGERQPDHQTADMGEGGDDV